MTKGDIYQIKNLTEILKNGCMDENPRPVYKDYYELDANIEDEVKFVYSKIYQEGNKLVVETPAHTFFVNHVINQYDIGKGETPLLSLRPIAWKSAVKEIFWIYQQQSNKISDLQDMGIQYWNQWDIGDGTIGCRYGATVKRHDLMNRLLEGLKNDPFGRRHIMSLWQEDDFKDETGGTTKGLVPCCYETIWNVRRNAKNEMVLDMLLNQRSSDYIVSAAINEIQYVALMLMVCCHLGYKPGRFTHVIENCQIYDRHLIQAKQLIKRKDVACSPLLMLNCEQKNFYDITFDDFKLLDYPIEKIKSKNPQMMFDLGI